MYRLVKAFACCLLFAAAAQAQITTSRLVVRITGGSCAGLTNVWLVMDDDDSYEKWIRLEPQGTCRWGTDFGSGGSFSTKLSHFSLRVDSARTDCRQAFANTEQLVAELEFPCCSEEKLRNIRVRTDPPMPVSYLRSVAAAAPKSIRCIEGGVLGTTGGTIRFAQLAGEDVYLQIGASKPNRKADGLLIDDVVADDGTLVLSRDGVAYQLYVQRAKGKSRISPTTSVNTLSIDIKKLGALKLERAEIEVSP